MLDVYFFSNLKSFLGSNEEDYYKPLRTGDAFSSNYIEYESNGNKCRRLQGDETDEIIEELFNSFLQRKQKG